MREDGGSDSGEWSLAMATSTEGEEGCGYVHRQRRHFRSEVSHRKGEGFIFGRQQTRTDLLRDGQEIGRAHV